VVLERDLSLVQTTGSLVAASELPESIPPSPQEPASDLTALVLRYRGPS